MAIPALIPACWHPERLVSVLHKGLVDAGIQVVDVEALGSRYITYKMTHDVPLALIDGGLTPDAVFIPRTVAAIKQRGSRAAIAPADVTTLLSPTGNVLSATLSVRGEHLHVAAKL